MNFRIFLQPLVEGRSVLEAAVQKAAEAGGLSEDEAFLLATACGDVHSFLCQAPDEAELEWHCQALPCFCEAQVWLPARPETWQALQACQLSGVLREHTRERLLPAAGLKVGQTSLMRAARAVELVTLRAEGRRVGLCLRKARAYPALEVQNVPRPAAQPARQVILPTPLGLEQFCQQIHTDHPDCPDWMTHPQQLADLMASDQLEGLLALGESNACLGGLFWRLEGQRLIEVFGPYLLAEQPPEVAEALLENCLQRVARGPALAMMIRAWTPDLPKGQFETLGHVQHWRKGEWQERAIGFRLLHEDPGGTVWAPPGWEEWLKEQYRHLSLGREVLTPSLPSASLSPFSAFSTEVSAEQSTFLLVPIQAGRDLVENLQRYLEAGTDAGFRSIFLRMDLGEPWQAALGPELTRQGFVPRLVRPLGGKTMDALLWQYEPAQS